MSAHSRSEPQKVASVSFFLVTFSCVMRVLRVLLRSSSVGFARKFGPLNWRFSS